MDQLSSILNKMDNVFTINLPGSDLAFTRYLYAKDEVRVALLVSILNKSDDAIFWAYELYYSGFKHELFWLIWKIYYDFFATLNPNFEQYFIKKSKEYFCTNDDNLIVSSIIQTLLFRPFNADVFTLRNIANQFDLAIEYCITNVDELRITFEKWIAAEDYSSISQWIFNINKAFGPITIYQTFLDAFGLKKKEKLIKEFKFALELNINYNTILIAKIMTLLSNRKLLKKGKNIYIITKLEDIILYKNTTSNECANYKILEKSHIRGIDDFNHLSLFKLKRSKYNLKEKYLNNWEYHAYYSPIWFERICKYSGYPDYEKQKIMFVNDDCTEQFYELYGLEPDEQPQEIQDKSIKPLEHIYDWKWFINKYKGNGIFTAEGEEAEWEQVEY